MTVEHAREMERQMTETAAGEGLDFRFDIARSGTTFDAHRLVHLAAQHGLQDAMKERLLCAYFGEGELMSDPDTLVRLAGEVGVAEDEVREMLAGDRFAEEVREDERMAQAFGISAVPTFVVDRKLGASGAHPPEALLRLLTEGWTRREPAPAIVTGGETCDADGNC
jgi:predicted DsbA family dithiol-disulfide isomerase